MARIGILLSFVVLLFNTSCKKCVRCSYTYTKTTIIQTVNGEQEIIDTLTGYILDDNGLSWIEQCEKEKDYTSSPLPIETAYELASDSLLQTLDNFSYTCAEF